MTSDLDNLDDLIELALESADKFLKLAHSPGERVGLVEACLANCDLVLALWQVASDDLEWLPIKGAKYLKNPERYADQEIIVAGIPCCSEHTARHLLDLTRTPGAFEVKH